MKQPIVPQVTPTIEDVINALSAHGVESISQNSVTTQNYNII